MSKIELFTNIEFRQWVWEDNWYLIFFPWILGLSFNWTLTRFICRIWLLFSFLCLWKLSCFTSWFYQLIFSATLNLYLTILRLDTVSTIELAHTMLARADMLIIRERILSRSFTRRILIPSEAFFKAKFNVSSWLVGFFVHSFLWFVNLTTYKWKINCLLFIKLYQFLLRY